MRKKLMLLSTLLISLTACWQQAFVSSQNNSQTDYKQQESWISKPDTPAKQVDVFYIYPTVFSSDSMLNMDIKDPEMQELVMATYRKQIGVYSDTCNVYAPYYQQMSMYVLNSDTIDETPYLEIAFEDVKNAFMHYMQYENTENRPFALAGHSQGSEMLLKLMKDSIFSTFPEKQLVAAYLIGYSVTQDDLDTYNLKMAQNESDTGVIISYNTQSAPNLDSPVLTEGARCVNPLIWTTTDSFASSTYNLGAVFINDNGGIDSIVPEFTDAQIDLPTGALIVTDSNTYGLPTGSFDPGVYHKYDYTFFYLNLKENVNKRVGTVLGNY